MADKFFKNTFNIDEIPPCICFLGFWFRIWPHIKKNKMADKFFKNTFNIDEIPPCICFLGFWFQIWPHIKKKQNGGHKMADKFFKNTFNIDEIHFFFKASRIFTESVFTSISRQTKSKTAAFFLVLTFLLRHMSNNALLQMLIFSGNKVNFLGWNTFFTVIAIYIF